MPGRQVPLPKTLRPQALVTGAAPEGYRQAPAVPQAARIAGLPSAPDGRRMPR